MSDEHEELSFVAQLPDDVDVEHVFDWLLGKFPADKFGDGVDISFSANGVERTVTIWLWGADLFVAAAAASEKGAPADG